MSVRTDRIEARLEPRTAARIKEAAAIAGLSASAFMVAAAADRADVVLRSQQETTVSPEFFEELLKALDEPPKTIPALERAFARLRDLTSDSGTAIASSE